MNPVYMLTRSFLIIISLFISLISLGQEKQKVYMSMDTKMIVNEYRLIEVTLRTRVDGKFHPIQDAEVEILMKTEESDKSLANILTNTEGVASLVIEKDYSYFKDEEGKYTILAKFKGNNNFKKASKRVKVRDLSLKAGFNEVDSVKKINISALEFIKDSLTIPEKDVDYKVFVDRMFADLELASGTFKEGEAEVIIPNDIPGNPTGYINLIIRVDERDYQLVELTTEINWGVPLKIEEARNKNATTISYIAFMITSVIVISILGLLLSRRINNKT